MNLLEWAKQLKAISQAGQTYCKDTFDLERYHHIEQIAFEMMSELSGSSLDQVKKILMPETHYPTPKVDIRAGVFKDNKILLVRERSDGCWSLPGGWADVCETPSQGIIREVFEESGFCVSNPRLVAVKDRDIHPYLPKFPFHIYKMFFICQLDAGKAIVNHEISDIDFFELSDLPELSVDRVLPEDIRMLFDYKDNTNVQVYVD